MSALPLADTVSHRRIWRLAGPIILSNLSTPLLGAIDTAVIGRLGAAHYIGAVAVGALVFNFLYWGFGFLRMGTTGLTAQALGADDAAELHAALGRAVGLALAIALILLLLQVPVGAVAIGLIGGSPEVQAGAGTYFAIRIWGTPAALTNYALLGWFIGLQRAQTALALQLWLNGVNAALDILFVLGLGWGVAGIAAGTVIAEISAAALGLALAWRILRRQKGAQGQAWDWPRLREPAALRRLLAVNGDIFLRTLCLIAAFAWFTAQSARAGDLTLAANAVLLHFLTFTAYGLDGFAFAAEALVGAAVGARDRRALRLAARRSSLWALLTGAAFAAAFAALGPWLIDLMAEPADIRAEARAFLPWLVALPLVSVWCFQLDGIFIGATRTATMRNAMLVSLLIYLAAWAMLAPALGNHGLWAAFLVFFAARGLTLGACYPALERSCAASAPPRSTAGGLRPLPASALMPAATRMEETMASQQQPDADTQAVLDRMASSELPKINELPPEGAREMFAQSVAALDMEPVEVGRIEDRTIPNADGGPMRVRLYHPQGAQGKPPILVYFHGGGFVIGSIETHDRVCRYLCRAAGILVMSVDYRLAPEHKFPAAVEDSYAAVKWAAAHADEIGADASRLAVGGDSAGGNISAVVCQFAKLRGGPKIAFQMLWYPVTGPRAESGSMKDFASGYFLEAEMMQWFIGHYLPAGAKQDDHRLSPNWFDDLSNLPPALVVTAGFDPLRDEGKEYAERMRAAGVPVEYRCYESTIHGFFNMGGVIGVTRKALDGSAAALRQALGVSAKAAE